MRRRVLILLAALVLAGVSGIAVLSYARSADRRAVSGKEGVWVVVAKERIPPDTIGSAAKALTERILVPAETVPKGALNEWDPALDGMRLAVALEPSQLVMRPLFHTESTAAGNRRLSVPKGELAVTVALSIAPQVAGDVAADDKVAVYGTCPATGTEEVPQKTRLLLPAATVRTIGEAPMPQATVAQTAPADGTPAPSATTVLATPSNERTERYVVTLGVNERDAPRLVHAARTCLIYLALLGPSTSVTPGPAVDAGELYR
jgi:pilus assembly protein CpaB